MSAIRHSIQRMPGGGVSLGFSGFKQFEECKEQFYWGYVHGGTGIEPQADSFQFERCYGSLWHELWRHCAVEGRQAPLDPPFKEWCRQEGYNPSEHHILSLYRTLIDDLEWYWANPGQIKIKTLLAEQELHAPVKSAKTGLTHTLRGTPDVVGEVEGAWGGGIYIVDGKTFKCIGNDGRLYVDVADFKKAKDGRNSAQFPAYMGLWNMLNPDQAPIYDGIAHFVPQKAAEAERCNIAKKGNRKPVRVQDEFVFVNPDLVAWTMARWTQACDDIATWLDANDPHDEFRKRANSNACIDGSGGWVRQCPFLGLCETTNEVRADLINGAWQQRQLIERREAA